jgi:VWFA-related protein
MSHRLFAPFSALVLLILLSLTCLAQNSPGVKIEFPAGGRLQIENDLGSVTAVSADQKFVSVTADGAAASLSSVVIDNRSQGLVIRVSHPGALSRPINLTVSFPESAQVSIETKSGQVSLRGMPASITIKSVNGDIAVDAPGATNLDVLARATQGQIRSELNRPLTEGGHVLQARIGAATQSLRLNSETGDISLAVADFTQASGESVAANPRLRDPVTLEAPTKAAGTPAPLTDSEEVSEGDVVRVDSQLVTLNLSVIDRETNRGLVGLSQSDFRLFENGTEQRILQFDSSSAPFDLLLVIDLSGSTRDVIKLIRAAALRFVDAARPSDRIGVITFAGQAAVVSPLTLDRRSLHDRISAMDTAAGDTKLYDAVEFAVGQSQKDTRNPRRTAIILMSDGLDGSIPGVQGDGSKLVYADLLNHVGEFDGVVYTLWLNTEYEALSPLDTQPEAFDAGYDRMKEMADKGGGVFYEVESLEDLAGAYERVVADLGTVYSLAYRPLDKARDGKWRAIKVNVARPAAIARGKRGYYAN